MQNMRLLIFCAHADDEVIGMGGTIRKFADAGAKIRLVMFSEGAEGYGTLAEKNTIVATRDNETRKVCELLGIGEYFNLHGLDWDLKTGNSTYRAVIHHIREFRPDIVFTHAELDYNDHSSVSKVVREGWFHATLACAMEPGEEIVPLMPLYEFEVIHRMTAPTHLVDISDTFEYKRKAMEIYGSQTGVVGSSIQMLEGRAMEYGYMAKVRYAEAFHRSDYRPRTIHNIETLLEKQE